MHRLGLCGAFVLAALFVPPAHGQVKLAWKWKKGGKFFVRTETKVQQTVVVEDPRGDVRAPPAALGGVLGAVGLAGTGKAIARNTAYDREIRQTFRHVAYLQYEVLEENKDGTFAVRQQIVKELKLLKGPGNKDEEEHPVHDPLLGPAQGKAGAELILHLTPTGEVTRVEGQDKLLEKLASADTEKRQALQEALSETSLKRALSEALGFLPAERVKVSDGWKRTAELNLGPLGRVEVEHRYAYEGKGEGEDKELDRIDRTTQLIRFAPEPRWPSPVPLGAAAGGTITASAPPRSLSFRVTQGTFRLAEGKGSLFFDADKGRLARASTEARLEGTLTIRNSATTYRTRLVQQQSTLTEVKETLDKLPKE